MKRFYMGLFALAFVFPTMAVAADVPVQIEYTQQEQERIDWSGLWLGISAGPGFGNNEVNVPGLITLNGVGMDGWAVNAIVGYNVQVSDSFVLGVQGQYGFADYDTDIGLFGGFISATGQIDWTASLAARLGWLPHDRAMLYALLGYGWTEVDATVGIGVAGATFSQKYDGLIYGAGLEVAITPNVFAGLEWTHADYGSENWGTNFLNVDLDTDAVVGRLTYKFSGSPIANMFSR